MNRLWIFGDSMSSDYGTHLLYPKTGDSWDRLLAKDLRLELSNKSRAGSGNDLIVRELINNMHLMREGDLVIIGLSNALRYYLEFDNEKDLWYKKRFIGNWLLWNQKKGLISNSDNPVNDNHPVLNIIVDFYKNVWLPVEKPLEKRDTKRVLDLQLALSRRNIKSLSWKWNTKGYPNNLKNPIETVGEKIGKQEAHFSFKGHKDFYNRLKEQLDNNKIHWDNIYE